MTLTSRQQRYRSLFGIAFAVVIGCASSPEDSLRKAPSGTSAPEVAEQTSPPSMDPATAARVERVRQSLEQGMDVNKADGDGRTALMMAAFEGYTEVVRFLLDNGAEADLRDGAGRTAMMYASSGPFPQTVELLVQSGADVNVADNAEGWTALMFAAAEGQQAVVLVLARHGADIEVTDQDGDAAIHHARERGQTHIVALLTEIQANN
jgi:ankyrin repeat protein